ncbi:MAG TPA: hypothetical protein VN736_20850 [Candidatus Limnocylindrales bacterium]|nr:hypothetical protein [Candidatus Limnocylindrales bacterium]
MPFEAAAYGPQVAALLKLIDAGAKDRAAEAMRDAAESLFERSRAPRAALAGLYLRAGSWKDAHETASGIETPDGSFWHAIVHREEPDPANSAYWFRQTGEHPVFPALAAAASETGRFPRGAVWDPYKFIDLCESARKQPGSDLERTCNAIRQAEWELLFDWCARRPEIHP